MTQGENVNPYPRKQKRKEGKFPIKEKAKKKRKEIPNQRVEESKKKRKKIPNQRMGERKRKRKEGKKAPDQGSKENRRNVQRGLWTGQYLNNTELSPNERKKKEREPRPKIVFSL